MPRTFVAVAAVGLAAATWWWACTRPGTAMPSPAAFAPDMLGGPRIAPLHPPGSDLSAVAAAVREFLADPAHSDPARESRGLAHGPFDTRSSASESHLMPMPVPAPALDAPPDITRLESLVQWLRQQEGVADVRVPGGEAEGVRAYALLTSLPARIPVGVDLWVEGPEGARALRTCTLVVELDTEARVLFVDLHVPAGS